MSKSCRILTRDELNLANLISQVLSAFPKPTEDQPFDFDSVEQALSDLYNSEEYDSVPNKKDLFNRILRQTEFFDKDRPFDLEKKTADKVQSQLVIDSLSHKNFRKIFINADNVLAHVNQTFYTGMFKYTFINRDRKDDYGNDVETHLIQTPAQFNQGVMMFKNHLVKVIVDGLGLQEIFPDLQTNPIFTKKGADLDRYLKLMGQTTDNPAIGTFLSKPISNPTVFTEDDMDIFSAIYLLNNFDTFVTKEMGSIVNLNINEKGTLGNTNYAKKIIGDSTSYWLADTQDAKSSERFISHLAKFIVSIIPKVNEDGTNSKYKYMTTADLFMASGILKQAEYEYFVLDPYSDVCLLENPKEALKKLLHCDWSKVTILEKFKRELIPFKRFLYESTDDTMSIEEVFKTELETCKDDTSRTLTSHVLDIESLLAFEINKNITPTYLQYDFNAIMHTINLSQAYKASNYVLDTVIANTTDFIVSDDIPKSLKTGRITFGPEINPGEEYTFESLVTRADTEELINQIRQYPDSEFNEVFQLVFGTPITEAIIQDLVSKRALSKIVHVLQEVRNALENVCRELEHKEIDQTSDIYSLVKDLYKKLKGDSSYDSVSMAIAKGKEDQPHTNFDNYSGSAIPVYRLNSAAFNDLFFIRNYKKKSPYRSRTNLLVKNPNLFSRINRHPGSGALSEVLNYNYQGTTGIKLDIGSTDEYYDSHTATADVTFINNFLGDFLGFSISKDVCGIQPTEFSDKSSVLDKFINLQAEVTYYQGEKEQTGIIGLMSNDSLKNMLYSFRKNQMLDLIKNVLDSWHEYDSRIHTIPDYLFQACLKAPYLTEELSVQIDALWNECNDAILKLNSKDFAKRVSEINNTREIGNEFTLTQELHYSAYGNKKGGVRLNNSIKAEFDRIRSIEKFNEWRFKLEQGLVERPIMTHMDKLIHKMLHKMVLSDPKYLEIKTRLYPDELKINPDGSEYMADFSELIKELILPKMPEVVTELKIGETGSIYKIDLDKLAQRFLLFDNLISIAYLDLTVKEPYIDVVKKGFHEDHDLELEARYEATTKRMVILPGTVENFEQGLVNGVPTLIRVAIVSDPKLQTANLKGEKNDQDIFDGSGYVSPVYSRLENNSLPGRGIYGTKKTLGMYTSDYASALFKWAEFEISNTKIRDSIGGEFSLYNMMKKMHSVKFGRDIDLTVDFNGVDLDLMKISEGKRIFYSQGLNNYEIEDIEKVGENEYIIYQKLVDDQGNELAESNDLTEKHVIIETLFDLWEVFGGCESKELINGELQYSEMSMDILTNYVNNIGEYRNGKLVQTLKDKFISILANSSAIKRGVTNLNSAADAWSSDTPLNWFTINTNAFGIQLDANHHVDMSELTEMSLTISALASKGYTLKYANDAYNEIANIIRTNTISLDRRIKDIENSKLNVVLQSLSRDFIEELAKEDKISLAQNLADKISRTLGAIIPFSNPNFYNLLIKNVIQDLNKAALKRKYTGSGEIVNPTSNVLQLYELGDESFLKTDLINKARRLFKDIPGLHSEESIKDLTSDEIAQLYVICKGSKGPEIFTRIQSGEITLDNIHEEVLSKYGKLDGYGLETVNSQEVEFLSTVSYILKGDPEHKLITKKLNIIAVQYKNGIAKQRLDEDGLYGYQDFINLDPDTFEVVYQNNTVPHDLLPQDIFYKVNDQKQSIFGFNSVSLETWLSEIEDDSIAFKDAFDQLTEDGILNQTKEC